MPHPYAQSNLQLFSQMVRQGYAAAEVLAVAAAYDLARSVFHGHFRGSGKAFLEHLVGTASILVGLNADVALLTSAMLHAHYSHGLPPPVLVPPWRRARLRRLVGPESELLISLYSQLPWQRRTIPLIAQHLDRLDRVRQQVLLLRLANELEDQLDLGLLLCGNGSARCLELRHTAPLLVQMAERLGHPQLAAALAQASASTLAHEHDPLVHRLRSTDPHSVGDGVVARTLGRVRRRLAGAGSRALALASQRNPVQCTQRWLTDAPLAVTPGCR